MLELGLIAALGFLGSFGHCVGMCGPIAMAFSLSAQAESAIADTASRRWQQFTFHLWLNLGRLLSYALVGAAIGGLGSVLVAGGQMAGVGSLLRRSIALLTGGLLVALGLKQVAPQLFPKLPLLHPLQGVLHGKLQQAMAYAAQKQRWWTPALLGLAWGLVPCGFLYAAQIKAAETSSLLWGAVTMLAFGLGTMPVMVGLGVSSAWFSRDRTSQLFQLGGWITLSIGLLTLVRTGDLMVDYAGHLAIFCLALALIARPISKLWSQPLKFRRLLGVGAFVLAAAHTVHMLEHSWNWNLAAVRFMLPQHQWGMLAGSIALALMVPLTLTSTNTAQRQLGRHWRSLHLLSVPAIVLCGVHCTLAGSNYLGSLQWQGRPLVHTLLLAGGLLLVLAVRSRRVWQLLRVGQWYAASQAARPQPSPLPIHHS
ncbi:MAG: sulfite exporter TauE/SafE family protein [Leptolyngbya sp. SIO1E4]|nr:sulfite exporter TauE/SafE family protein [Leptolyngbya sp. SIO1E4]